MTPNPWERLREAAQRVDREFEECKGSVSGDAAYELSKALAALPATPPQQPVPDAKVADLLAENAKLRAEIGALESRVPDEERERAIENSLRGIVANALLGKARNPSEPLAIYTVTRYLIDDAVKLLEEPTRSAPAPQPMDGELEATRAALDRLKLELDEARIFLGTRGVGSGLMLERVKELYRVREAVAALETVATKRQNVDLRDAAHRILNGYSPCMNCGAWSRETEGHSPCNPVSVPATQPAEKPAPASDWRERFEEVIAGPTMHGTVKKAMRALRDGLAALEAEVAKLKEKP